jgi:pimeloyl-ACP methyl ester carboxylesterase
MIKTTSADGTAIAADRTGSGPALVLVAPALATRTAFAPLAELLAPHFTVYAYDRRGRGDSGDTPPYAADREVEDLVAVIRAAGGSANVFGHSSGAVLALDAAARGVGVTSWHSTSRRSSSTASRCPPTSPINSPVSWRRTGAVTRWRCGCAPPCG